MNIGKLITELLGATDMKYIKQEVVDAWQYTDVDAWQHTDGAAPPPWLALSHIADMRIGEWSVLRASGGIEVVSDNVFKEIFFPAFTPIMTAEKSQRRGVSAASARIDGACVYRALAVLGASRGRAQGMRLRRREAIEAAIGLLTECANKWEEL